MPGTTSTALPSFCHEQRHTTDAAKRKGCKYWQLNKNNEHASHYSRMKQRQRMRQHTINTHTQKHRINRQNRQKSTFPRSAYRMGPTSSSLHLRYTHRSSALPEGPLGGLPSLSLTTEGYWVHLGGVSLDMYNIFIFTTHRRPLTRQSLTMIRHRGWSGRIASLPLFSVSLPAGAAEQQPAGVVFTQ